MIESDEFEMKFILLFFYTNIVNTSIIFNKCKIDVNSKLSFSQKVLIVSSQTLP